MVVAQLVTVTNRVRRRSEASGMVHGGDFVEGRVSAVLRNSQRVGIQNGDRQAKLFGSSASLEPALHHTDDRVSRLTLGVHLCALWCSADPDDQLIQAHDESVGIKHAAVRSPGRAAPSVDPLN